MADLPNTTAPKRAMVLAAGLGTRMRPFNGKIPKPLVQVGGKPLIDYVLDRLAEQGVERAVVNVHHLADQIERHLAARQRAADRHLGRAQRAARHRRRRGQGAAASSAPQPFFHVNSDTIWIDGVKPNLARLAAAFDPARMDALLLLAPTATSIGYSGRGDFAHGARRAARARAAEREVVPFVYAGAAILSPAFFADAPAGPSSHVAAVRPRRRGRTACSGCGWKACGCMSARPDAIMAAEAAIRRQRGVNFQASASCAPCCIRSGV